MASNNGVERKRGNQLGFWFFRTAMRLFGLRGAYGLLYIVCTYYLLADRPLVAASLAYTRRRFPAYGQLRQLFAVYLLLVSQGKSLIDRYALAAGYRGIAMEIRGLENLERLAAAGNGVIVLTAHVGNWQAAMIALGGLGRTIHLMMRAEDNVAVKKALNIERTEENVKIIPTDDPLNSVLEAMKALAKGDLVSIMGDRTYGYGALEATFLGDAVSFPYSAFSLAAAGQCPVVVLLSAKVGTRKYLVDVSHVIPAPAGGRGKKEAIKAAVQTFATVLEGYVSDHPYQWFAFRDVWKTNE